jgi:lipopolysaccharide export system protein LptA
MGFQRSALEIGRFFFAAFRMFGMLAPIVPWLIATALAQTPVGGFSGLGGANSKKPIDIESDRLEVDDKRHLAIFIGNVSATQGDYNLKAPRLEVTYENASQSTPADKNAQAQRPVKPAKAPGSEAAADPLSSGQIKFIHALGGIVVLKSQKDEQESTGEDAIYDVKAQKVTMTGKKVVLTQKKNIVEGRKLLVDLATGQATVIPDDETAQGGGPAHKGRVRAVFQQEGGKGSLNPLGGNPKDQTPKPQPASPPQKTEPSAGWQAQSH